MKISPFSFESKARTKKSTEITSDHSPGRRSFFSFFLFVGALSNRSRCSRHMMLAKAWYMVSSRKRRESSSSRPLMFATTSVWIG